MKQLMLNDGRSMEVQSVAVSGGVMHIRMILTTYEQLKAYFMDEFVTSVMTLYENGKKQAQYENYTILEYIKEESGGIWEVEMRQTKADTDTRLTALEEKTTQQESDIKDLGDKAETQKEELDNLKTEVEESGKVVDPTVYSASVVVAKANFQALPDIEAVEAKVLAPEWDPNGVLYPVNYKVTQNDVLYKCLQEHTSQESWAPGVAPSLWTAIESGEHAGTLEDPIPVPETVQMAGMEYEKGKYYSESGTIYLMDRQGMEEGEKVTLYFAPSALIGQYFSAAEE